MDTYLEYRDNLTLEYEGSGYKCSEFFTVSKDRLSPHVLEFSIKILNNPLNFTKCRISKEYLRLQLIFNKTQDENVKIGKAIVNYDKIIVNLKKLLTDNINKSLNQSKSEIEKDNTILELNKKLKEAALREKAHKKEIKELKNMISRMTFINNSRYDDNIEQYKANSDTEPEEEDIIHDINLNDPSVNFINTYEKVKRYMVENEASIGSIACRNGYNQRDIRRICNSFIRLKQLRNIDAHPTVEPIENDLEFLHTLSSF
jgi:hypothetical protein